MDPPSRERIRSCDRDLQLVSIDKDPHNWHVDNGQTRNSAGKGDELGAHFRGKELAQVRVSPG